MLCAHLAGCNLLGDVGERCAHVPELMYAMHAEQSSASPRSMLAIRIQAV